MTILPLAIFNHSFRMLEKSNVIDTCARLRIEIKHGHLTNITKSLVEDDTKVLIFPVNAINLQIECGKHLSKFHGD